MVISIKSRELSCSHVNSVNKFGMHPLIKNNEWDITFYHSFRKINDKFVLIPLFYVPK